MEVRPQETVQAGDLRLSRAHVGAQTTVVSGSRVAELEEESPMSVAAVTKAQIRDTAMNRWPMFSAKFPELSRAVSLLASGMPSKKRNS